MWGQSSANARDRSSCNQPYASVQVFSPEYEGLVRMTFLRAKEEKGIVIIYTKHLDGVMEKTHTRNEKENCSRRLVHCLLEPDKHTTSASLLFQIALF